MTVALSLFALDLQPRAIASLYRLLDAEERAQAGRFRDPRHAIRFVARRGQMRLLLAEAMHETPEAILIERTQAGKPFVAGGLHFSLSHSGSVGLLALSGDAEIGCDIERRDPDLADRGVAERLFAPAERRALAELDGERWVVGFFNCWTRKEAVVKAIGHGLSYPLDSFEVSVTPGSPAVLLTPIGAHRLHTFEVAPDHQAAVCVASDQPVAPPRWVTPIDHKLHEAA